MYKLLSALLSYPSVELQQAMPEIRQLLSKELDSENSIFLLCDELAKGDLISIQENYVDTFDRNRGHALHLFEHLHGEDRARGQALVDLLSEYQKRGLEPMDNEMPDYLPLFLEFLAIITLEEQQNMLADAVHVIAHIGRNLHKNHSSYASIFSVIEQLSPVASQPLKVAPIKDMDEALETFGPTIDGLEPLLNQTINSTQEVKFFASMRKQTV